jgi:hypothetical protein
VHGRVQLCLCACECASSARRRNRSSSRRSRRHVRRRNERRRQPHGWVSVCIDLCIVQQRLQATHSRISGAVGKRAAPRMLCHTTNTKAKSGPGRASTTHIESRSDLKELSRTRLVQERMGKHQCTHSLIHTRTNSRSGWSRGCPANTISKSGPRSGRATHITLSSGAIAQSYPLHIKFKINWGSTAAHARSPAEERLDK